MNSNLTYYGLLCSLLIFVAMPVSTFGQLAFPGAEGYGANSVGGRGGQVIIVRNLNDNGPGSFRAAVTAAGPRIVVFEVSGIINLESPIRIYNPFLTIAGQTSPGGILVTGYTISVNTNDFIMQHMRIRVGSHRIADGADPETLDAFNVSGSYWGPNSAYNIMIDHCSFSWGVDETITFTGGVIDATIQWCIVTEGLRQAGHPDGEHSKGLMVSGKYVNPSTVSIHHNYIAHNTARNPRIYSPDGVDTRVELVNNVSYNWKGGLSPQQAGNAKVDWIHNYAKRGPNSNSYSFQVIYSDPISPILPLIYVNGNIGSSRMNQSDPQWNVGRSWRNELLSESYRQLTPWVTSTVTTAEMSYNYALNILQNVGATLPFRDDVDTRVVIDFENGTGAIIDNITYPDDFPTFQDLPAPQDSDNDGMPDTWETAKGLNPNDASDQNGTNLSPDGYTNIEVYLHELTGKASSIKKGESSLQLSNAMVLNAYPNPITSLAEIQFSLPLTREIKLEVYNINGALVKTLLQGMRSSGIYRINWNGSDNQSKFVSSGNYLVRLSAEENIVTQKSVLLVR